VRILRFDSVGGASGDMILGALVGLGVDPHQLEHELASLGAERFSIAVAPFSSHGIGGVQAAVELGAHGHHAHDHGHDHAHAHGEHTHAPHRGLREIAAMIERSALPPPVRELSLRVFRRIAEAEAKIHGTTVEEIHFHEVGAMDSIVDVVGGCLALHRLRVDSVVIGPLPIGHGTIRCAHGTYPSPAPATVELLAGAAVEQVDEPFETVTPTGAALLTTWKTADALPAGARVVAASYSFGHRRLNHRPNLLRATLFEADALTAAPASCLVLECNLDDTSPELIGALTVRLLEAGALDVFTAAIQMKKQRPGVLLTVLCEPAQREPLLDLIFRGSTTFGVRAYPVERTVLARRHETVNTPYGPIRVKIGTWKGADVTRAPEFEDCARAAREQDVPVRAVYEAALRA
jgi:uncharacterized protein (TIGR00299 family) protein